MFCVFNFQLSIPILDILDTLVLHRRIVQHRLQLPILDNLDTLVQNALLQRSRSARGTPNLFRPTRKALHQTILDNLDTPVQNRCKPILAQRHPAVAGLTRELARHEGQPFFNICVNLRHLRITPRL